MQVDLAIETPEWLAVQQINELIEKAINVALEFSGLSKYVNELDTVSVLLADDSTIQNLNKTYRNKNQPTNVLSFPYIDIMNNKTEPYPRAIGDIAISYQTIAAEALEYSKSLNEHLSHMLIHGMLHLLQYDHQNRDEASKMEAIETKCMHDLGYKDFEYEPILDHKSSSQQI